MSFTTTSLKPRSNRPIKVQIVSRDIPVENTIGNVTYILDFIRYLQQAECEIDFTLLNSSPNGKTPWYVIPFSLVALANVSAKDNLRIGRLLLRLNSLLEWLIAPLRLAYNQFLPEKLKNIYRSTRDERQKTHNPTSNCQFWDAPATLEEVAFASARFVRFQPDVMVVNYAFLGNVLDSPVINEKVLKVILTHDVRHQRVADFKKLEFAIFESDWSWEQETIELSKAQVLLAIQEEDANLFKEITPQCEVISMPMSAVCHYDNGKQIPGRCLFVGSSADHNYYGLQWFLENVWPTVIQLLPNSSLHVCGTVCDLIQGTFPNVRLLGRVEDLKPEYAAAELCLVPLLAGSGLKIKLVEALSHGRACVSTSIGVQGLREIVNRAVMVADTPEDFTASIHTLLNDPDQRRLMEEQALRYVRQKLSPQAAYQPFVDRIEQHLQQVANRTTRLSGGRTLTSNLMPNKEKSHEI